MQPKLGNWKKRMILKINLLKHAIKQNICPKLRNLIKGEIFSLEDMVT
jgi:hypothetical protein